MRLLLDTHVLLWALGDPSRLSPLAGDLLSDAANELYVSAVSLFEISMKHRLGKLPDAGVLLGDLDWTMARLAARYLPLDPVDAVLAGALPVPHRDPFDRLLAAQSQGRGIPLVSSDAAFGTFPDLDVRW